MYHSGGAASVLIAVSWRALAGDAGRRRSEDDATIWPTQEPDQRRRRTTCQASALVDRGTAERGLEAAGLGAPSSGGSPAWADDLGDGASAASDRWAARVTGGWATATTILPGPPRLRVGTAAKGRARGIGSVRRPGPGQCPPVDAGARYRSRGGA